MDYATLLDGHALLADIRHRHANAYQCILAMIGGELSRAAQPETIDALMRADLQIKAFALLNQLLDQGTYRGRNELPCAASYLRQLCRQLESACVAPRGATLRFVGDEPQLHPPDYCRNFGLIAAELVLNASKHAFCAGQEGAVGVTLVTSDADTTQLIVTDDGRGVETFEPTARRGLGFVQLLATSMGGRCAGYSDAGGTRITVTVPRPHDKRSAIVAPIKT